jgi:hypothetical protein
VTFHVARGGGGINKKKEIKKNKTTESVKDEKKGGNEAAAAAPFAIPFHSSITRKKGPKRNFLFLLSQSKTIRQVHNFSAFFSWRMKKNHTQRKNSTSVADAAEKRKKKRMRSFYFELGQESQERTMSLTSAAHTQLQQPRKR